MPAWKDISNLHCPRWKELPDLALYMDQVISVLEKSLSFFVLSEEEKLITPTMINNYVKQMLIPPPVKKRYGREQLAQLTIYTLLKQVFSLSDLEALVRYLLSESSMEAVYDCFCEEMEAAMYGVLEKGNYTVDRSQSQKRDLLHSAVAAYALQFYSRAMISERIPAFEGAPSEAKKKKKEKEKGKKPEGEEPCEANEA